MFALFKNNVLSLQWGVRVMLGSHQPDCSLLTDKARPPLRYGGECGQLAETSGNRPS